MGTADDDNRERRRALDAAVAHRHAIHRLADKLKLAHTALDVGLIVAEMNRVGDAYEAWLRADTVRLRARNDQSAAQLRDLAANA